MITGKNVNKFYDLKINQQSPVASVFASLISLNDLHTVIAYSLLTLCCKHLGLRRCKGGIKHVTGLCTVHQFGRFVILYLDDPKSSSRFQQCFDPVHLLLRKFIL